MISDDVATLIHEHGPGEFRVGSDAWFAMVQDMYLYQPLLVRESSLPTPATMFGMPICPDPDLPAGVIELRNSKGETLGRIENVGSRPSALPVNAQQEPRRVVEYDEYVYEDEAKQIIVRKPRIPAVTGPTTCLERRCGRCNDPLPAGATFCIECGEKV